MMLQQPEEHLQKARQWAIHYAGAPDEPMDMAPFLEAMGVGKNKEQADVYVPTILFLRSYQLTWSPAIKVSRNRWSTSS
jgi:hypothetical protein